jgi:hypothetical protein
MNFATTRGASNEALDEWREEDVAALYEEDDAALPLFDFHFHRVERGDEASLRYRATTLPPTLVDQCWTRDDWKAGKKDGSAHHTALHSSTQVTG